jgi:hypothetical protein
MRVHSVRQQLIPSQRPNFLATFSPVFVPVPPD